MEDYLQFGEVVDPEVRAHVYSLVTALGGASASADGRYVLGDDALACLKDIKRWLKLHDDKLNRLDVTRCLAEAHLVKGDLLEILGQWPEEAMNEKWRGRIALACVELLVPLTWPIEKDLMSEVTRNQHRHLPYIQVAQITYKREILEHPSSDLLRKAVRLALPSMAIPGHERPNRDEGVIKLITYFIRNIAMISAPANLPVEWNEQEVSRSATIKAFSQQGVFDLLLSMSSNVATHFKTQDVVLLEVLYHLIKGINPKKLFMSKPRRSEAASSELRDLMTKENALLKTFTKNAPTRHNRFGTMLWIERDESKKSTVTGQDILRGDQQMLAKMDGSKKWNKPKRKNPQDRTHMNFDLPEHLSDTANELMRTFVENFLDSGFNPLFAHLRKAIEREADQVLIAHSQQFWYLISWFLKAESERRAAARELHQKEHFQGAQPEFDSFGIVASVLNQETFILLNRFMQTQLDNRDWQELDAGMRCFTQILLTIQEMAESPLDEDQEIADNIQNNIFYEESTHDRVLMILRSYKDQGFSYLDATTDLAHVFLRMLERYSKENGDLQIRSRRKARKRKAENKSPQPPQESEGDNHQGSEAEDEEQAAKVSRERKFEFNRFANKFVNQHSINTFVSFLSYYKDLSNDQLKRAHRFFYRVAFKQEMTVLLFRLDIIQLLNRLVRSPDALHRSHPMYGEWTELIKQIFRRLIKKLNQRPELAVELLFSKIPATCYYLEFGYEKQAITTTPRAPAELEVRGGLSKGDQIGVVVAVLVGEEKQSSVEWVAKTLRTAANERQSWESLQQARAAETQSDAHVLSTDNEQDANETSSSTISAPAPAPAPVSEPPVITIVPDSSSRKLALFKDNKLRLLLTLCDAQRDGFRDDPEAKWTIPSSVKSSQLFNTLSLVETHMIDPRTTYGEIEDNPLSAADMLKRVAPSRHSRRSEGMFGSVDDEGLDDFLDDDEGLFPVGGPTARRSDALEDLKTKRRRKRRGSGQEEDLEEVDPEIIEARRLARSLRELEKRRRIKSTEFVHASDEESDSERDEEFFTKEQETARKRVADHNKALEQKKTESTKGKRKRSTKDTVDDDEDDDDVEFGQHKKLRSSDDDGTDNDSLASEEDIAGLADLYATDESDADGLFVGSTNKKSKKRSSKQRRKPVFGDDAAEHSTSETDDLASGQSLGTDEGGEDNHGEEHDEITPLSSQSEPHLDKLALADVDGNRIRTPQQMDLFHKAAEQQAYAGNGEDEEDDGMPTQRRRARATVLDDSDSE